MKWFVLLGLWMVAGCGPAVSTMLMGAPRSALREDCPLEMITVTPEDIQPSGKYFDYEVIGAVLMGLDAGTDALSEKVRQLVRPRACKMGGVFVSLGSSVEGRTQSGFAQQNIVYNVWAKKQAKEESPKPF